MKILLTWENLPEHIRERQLPVQQSRRLFSNQAVVFAAFCTIFAVFSADFCGVFSDENRPSGDTPRPKI